MKQRDISYVPEINWFHEVKKKGNETEENKSTRDGSRSQIYIFFLGGQTEMHS